VQEPGGDHYGRRIAAIQGASNREVQDAMWRFARRWSSRGVRIAGLIEQFGSDPRPRHTAELRNITTGAVYPLFQNLGPMAEACHLDGAGIVAACVAIRNEIERGCDLAILSKFGQLEAARSGLTDAFVTATERNIPILTAVSPTYTTSWSRFSAPLGVILPADDAALDLWWSHLGGAPHTAP
jgi:hypothetical protein